MTELVRWLWIDSLCILQDSKEDWQQEAPMMYDVYKNALLNISADDSPDTRGGCFRERDPLAVLPMHLEFAGSDGRPFFLIPHQSDIFSSVNEAPLAKRGWVFQERQLSRRVLHFTSHELMWECCADAPYFASETFPEGSPFPTAFNGKPKFLSHTNLRDLTRLPELYATWDLLCREYTTKHFSHKRDKLVALSGLAQEFAAAFPHDQYVAGMWRSTLPESLLWQSDSSARPFPTEGHEYVAPSWSWASIDGIADPLSVLDKDCPRYPLVDILYINTKPVVPSNPTGLLRSASISLACFLRPIEIRPDYEKKRWTMMAMMSGGKAHRLIFKNSKGHETASMDSFFRNSFAYSLDAELGEDSGPESVSGHFLPLCVSPQEEKVPVFLSGLIVQAVAGRRETFRRVGVLYVYGKHCLKVKYEAKPLLGDWTDWEIWRELEALLMGTHESWEKVDEEEAMNRYYAERARLGHGSSRSEVGSGSDSGSWSEAGSWSDAGTREGDEDGEEIGREDDDVDDSGSDVGGVAVDENGGEIGREEEDGDSRSDAGSVEGDVDSEEMGREEEDGDSGSDAGSVEGDGDNEEIGREEEDDDDDSADSHYWGSFKGKQKVIPRVGVDLVSVKPLDRLYALDVAVEGSEVEERVKRLRPRRITLV